MPEDSGVSAARVERHTKAATRSVGRGRSASGAALTGQGAARARPCRLPPRAGGGRARLDV